MYDPRCYENIITLLNNVSASRNFIRLLKITHRNFRPFTSVPLNATYIITKHNGLWWCLKQCFHFHKRTHICCIFIEHIWDEHVTRWSGRSRRPPKAHSVPVMTMWARVVYPIAPSCTRYTPARAVTCYAVRDAFSRGLLCRCIGKIFLVS